MNAANLPVMVYIHGGGYGQGNASTSDLNDLIVSNDNRFIGVSMQYRLGAFGFLSSEEVFENGTVNAGMYDIMFSLLWVQQHIDKFGGDASRVTISGVSAGAGAVMLADMAFGGHLKNALFEQGIASSPYLPQQYDCKAEIPTQNYRAFAELAGCANLSSGAQLDCLRKKDSNTLTRASQNVSASGLYGTWAFVPVTDGDLVQTLPSKQLTHGRLNGQRILSGNSANEGASFVPRDIDSEEDLRAWLKKLLPNFSTDAVAEVLSQYPSSDTDVDAHDPLFATNGLSGPTAINQSSVATGQQQRAFNIYAETTFVCPSYWLAEAYDTHGGQAWKYQYSVPLAQHANDVNAYIGPPLEVQAPAFTKAFMRIVGNFVVNGNPSISPVVAAGNATSNAAARAASDWPAFKPDQPLMLNLNQTGGVAKTVSIGAGLTATELIGPGQSNDFFLVNAYKWEGGRGSRCDFWKKMGEKVPE
jgi:carboxylesterase type B